MTDNTEAHSEALELADRLIGNAEIDECEGCNPVVVDLERAAATELRRQHAEIQQLKAEKAEMARLHFENYEFQRTKADNATATVYQFHYAMKDAGWHPGRTDDDLTEIIRAKGRELAQLSARQAAPDAIGHVRIDSGEVHIYPRNRDAESSGLIDGQLVYAAAPPSHEWETRTHEWHHNSRVESAAGIRDALSGMGVYLTITTILQLVDITRKAHGIGATNG